MTTDTNIHNRLALVIGSGSVKCAAGLGLYKALQRAGISPDLVVGCSGGGLIVSTIALGYSASDIEALMLKLWTRAKLSRRLIGARCCASYCHAGLDLTSISG